ncbi:FecR domain-containing protein [Flavobacteriaceae bacterium]|nr:FecR domain-containing protein [Flavobacteriaceae bacterium]
MDVNTKKLIVKFLAKEANLKELRQLEQWIRSPENEHLFKEYFKANHYANKFLKTYDLETAKKNILQQINLRKAKSNYIFKYAVAATLALILTTTYFFGDSLFNTTDKDVVSPPIFNANTIEHGKDKAVLTLENGSQIALEKGNSIQTQNATSNGKVLVYQNKAKQIVELVYNQLTVPRGGQFVVELSDGTKVWLNSESQLKYPVSFIKGQSREVELAYGEAYFDVSPSSKHKGAKFKVFNKFQEIDVLGTEFNIRAYKGESNVYTTLVEGKISVSTDNKNLGLKPNQQLDLDINNNTSAIKTVDVYNEVSWKDGVFSFESKTLEEVMKVFSRWYDIEIVFKNNSVKNEEFVGILRKNKRLETILNSFKNYGVIKNFEIEDKKVVLE